MHLISIREMPAETLKDLLSLSIRMRDAVAEKKAVPNLDGKVVGMLFLEDSTRTRVSFEQAARRLGLGVTIFGLKGTSMSKGESLKDTVLTLKHEGIDALVMRHSSSGASYLAGRLFGGPVINAGDGMHEHPTQALADALTILRHKQSVEGLTVAIVGDVMHSRVARSNIWALTKLGANVRIVGPRTLIPRHPAHFPVTVHYDLQTGIDGADVVMALRMQKERMDSGMISSLSEYASLYQVNTRTLRAAKPDCLVMHPGPINRGLELDDPTADGKNSVIVEQVENGVYVRMAAFVWAFGAAHDENGKSAQPPKPAAKPKSKAGQA
jgi:aspartate carbamoyltransferase catalytic subunit